MALQRLPGGKGEYNLCRIWEGEAMIALAEGDLEYYARPLEERARLVAVMKIPALIKELGEYDWYLTRGSGGGAWANGEAGLHRQTAPP